MSTEERISYIDHEVTNQEHESIGTVTDVLYDDENNEPKWLVVKPGALQAERIVPIEGSYEDSDGNVVVPFDKKWIKAAPKPGGDHVLSTETEDEASEHYDVD